MLCIIKNLLYNKIEMEIEQPIVITRNKKEISERQKLALEKAREAKAKKAEMSKTKLEPIAETNTEHVETKNTSMDMTNFFFPKREVLLIMGGVLLMSSTYYLTFGKTKQVTMKEIQQEQVYTTQSLIPTTKSGIILDF